MTLEEFAALNPEARPCGHGYRGPCPSCGGGRHSTKFSFTEQGGKLLLHCFGGCSPQEICRALGIEVRDLFLDVGVAPHEVRRRQAERELQKAKSEVERMAEGFKIDVSREAERFLDATVGTDILRLDGKQRDALMHRVCDALAVRMEEEREEYVNA